MEEPGGEEVETTGEVVEPGGEEVETTGEVVEPGGSIDVKANEAEKVRDLTVRPADDEPTADHHGRHDRITSSFV